MKIGHLKTISEYNTLIENLNPLGKYQIRIYIICVLYWMIAGLYATCFQMAFKSFKCPYAIGTFQGFGVLLFAWLSNLKGRKIGTLVAGITSLIGFILCLICVLREDSAASILGTFGIAIIGLSVYAQPYMLLSVVCQLTTQRIIQVVFTLSMAFYCIGRIWIVPVIDQIQQDYDDQNTDFFVTLCIILPCCVVSTALTFFINDSPRYFIENNIHKAEELVKKIMKINTGKQCEVTSIMDQNFILKRIHLRRYNFWTLSKFQSFGFSQYCTGVVMLLLGCIGRQAKYIFEQQCKIDQIQIQIVWISSFQLIGAIAAMFFLKFCKRKWTCIFTSFLTAIISTVLFSLPQNQIYENLILLALNSVFSTVLYVFLVINAIQFYAHSIRAFGLAMMLSLYYLGQLLFFIYWHYQPQPIVILELFLTGSWMMTAHCFGQFQTLNKGFQYQIKEIQQQQNEDI